MSGNWSFAVRRIASYDRKMEITLELDLTFQEESLLNMHSVVNVFNIISLELTRMSMALGGESNLDFLVREVVATARMLDDPTEARPRIESVEETITTIRSAIDAVPPTTVRERAEVVTEVRENLASIFDVLRVRARELLARWDDPDAWVDHDVTQLKNNFSTVFRAIERNSHGAYQIVNNIAQHNEGNYLMNFEITSSKGDTIAMPAVFQDVMRDLLANARKYTDPGGRIEGGLYENGRELRFVVSDSGRGIPEDEIEALVLFGARGSNARDKATRGGGFGLTKAYHITKRHNGRMWIDSTVNQGTVIGLTLPIPGATT